MRRWRLWFLAVMTATHQRSFTLSVVHCQVFKLFGVLCCRYFICQPNYGLFAPAHKVSRSPAAKRLSSANCAIHRPGRHGSRESLTSSIASAGGASVRSSIGGVSAASTRMRLGVNSLAPKQQVRCVVRAAWWTRQPTTGNARGAATCLKHHRLVLALVRLHDHVA